jgi:hypothetical protein
MAVALSAPYWHWEQEPALLAEEHTEEEAAGRGA